MPAPIIVHGFLAVNVFLYVESGLYQVFPIWVFWIALLTSYALCIPIYSNYLKDNVKDREAWLEIIAQIGLSMVILSFIHLASGIVVSEGCAEGLESCISTRWRDGLYFSIVTFTTLGYGDIHPTGYGRMFASFQALAGYLVLGLTVGAVLHWAGRK